MERVSRRGGGGGQIIDISRGLGNLKCLNETSRVFSIFG